MIEPAALEALVGALRGRGYRVLGPTVRDGAIVYDELESAADLPIGWTDVQDGGHYRLERREDEARFGYAVGPHSWKQFLLPPRLKLWQARRNGDGGLEVEEEPLDETPLAFLGVRSCELHAIAIQDRVFLGGRVRRPRLRSPARRRLPRRGQLLRARRHLLLHSMGTGPQAERGLRPRADRDPRRRAPAPRRGRQRARRRDPAPSFRGRDAVAARPRRPPAPPSTGAVRKMGRAARRDRPARPARAQPRAPALGRRRRALPDLRQLHDGLPDLLLHDRRGHDRPGRRERRARPRSGTRASRSTTRTSTAARFGPRAARATASG